MGKTHWLIKINNISDNVLMECSGSVVLSLKIIIMSLVQMEIVHVSQAFMEMQHYQTDVDVKIQYNGLQMVLFVLR